MPFGLPYGGLFFARSVVPLTDVRTKSWYSSTMKRFLANRSNLAVHDMENERPECEIAIIDIEHREWFESLRDAHVAGYHNCPHCLPLKLSDAVEG